MFLQKVNIDFPSEGEEEEDVLDPVIEEQERQQVWEPTWISWTKSVSVTSWAVKSL